MGVSNIKMGCKSSKQLYNSNTILNKQLKQKDVNVRE